MRRVADLDAGDTPQNHDDDWGDMVGATMPEVVGDRAARRYDCLGQYRGCPRLRLG